MLQNARELCTLLIRDIYGDVSSRVVDVLLEYGRMPISHLVRKVKLPERIIRQTLVVLIQQHLIRFYTHSDGGGDTVYYECDWQQIYELLHAGKIIRIVEERFGTDGASVISNFLLLGHAKVNDFISAYGVSTKPKGQALLNGTTNRTTNGTSTLSLEATGTAPISSTTALKGLLVKLLQEKFLVQVHDRHMHPDTDTDNALRLKFRDELKGSIATQIKLDRAVNEKLEEYKTELENAEGSEHSGMKRKSTSSQDRPRKRTKLNSWEEEEEDIWELDEKIVLRVNYNKFAIIYRNTDLARWVEQRIGKTTGLIYHELLKKLEKKFNTCKDSENKNPICTTHEIAKLLSPDINLDDTIGPSSMPNGNKSRKRQYANGVSTPNGGIKDEDDDDEEEQEEEATHEEELDEEVDGDDAVANAKRKRLFAIKEHMRLLAEDSMRFVVSQGTRGFGEWSVDYPRLINAVRSLEIEKIVEERYGSVASRLLRVIRDKGKLDEKQLAGICLLKQKDIRSHLSGLHEKGHLQIQEVPKSNDRAPSRTLYLFYYDEERAQRTMLHDIYKGMSRLIQRVIHERKCKSIVLSKAERTDVQGHEEEYLTQKELADIKKWREIEEKLLVQLMRLDRQVMLFRDW